MVVDHARDLIENLSQRRNLLRRFAAPLLIIVGLLVAACGGRSETGADAYAACTKSVKPTVDAVGALKSRLDVGLDQSEYSNRVGDVKVVIDRLDRSQLTAKCDKVASDLSVAVDTYATASSEWNDCIQSDYCSDPPVQKYWSKATKQVATAEADLAAIKQD
jgi:hypothetical protein